MRILFLQGPPFVWIALFPGLPGALWLWSDGRTAHAQSLLS